MRSLERGSQSNNRIVSVGRYGWSDGELITRTEDEPDAITYREAAKYDAGCEKELGLALFAAIGPPYRISFQFGPEEIQQKIDEWYEEYGQTR